MREDETSGEFIREKLSEHRPLGDIARLDRTGTGRIQFHDIILFDKKNPPRDERGWPVFGVVYGSDEPICGAKKRNKHAFCGQPRRKENGRCKHHGGNSLKGAASPAYKHGKTSK